MESSSTTAIYTDTSAIDNSVHSKASHDFVLYLSPDVRVVDRTARVIKNINGVSLK